MVCGKEEKGIVEREREKEKSKLIYINKKSQAVLW